MSILLVDDEPARVDAIERVLHSLGKDVIQVSRGENAVKFLECEPIDLVILDWQLSGMKALDVLRRIRSHFGNELPVLFMTSQLLEVDIVHALEAGANDYVLKPFSPAELGTRVSALLLEAQRNAVASHSKTIGAYSLDVAQRRISFEGRAVKLTEKEFDIIAYLFNNVGRIVSRDLLVKLAWGRELDSSSRTVDTHIYRLRRKLLLSPENGVRLTAIYTHGYRLDNIGTPATVAKLDRANDRVAQCIAGC
ncbi:DNA-binding response OmpR family regulator [Paraburkholderia sp. RAU2J]|uniref:response regulator transcription factor n=1 Tax=Paraburkholderia sp. RAU2J TaxID=1938810 RepID=UPI000EB2CFAD|nr:response regulator transcription factor [Paraburkholderia sp. RAU2J]RKT13728.1 DNA-binding response OmpR family regulator [Paraburkholderia sp. RAU2J]